jgi:hypothetical protein
VIPRRVRAPHLGHATDRPDESPPRSDIPCRLPGRGGHARGAHVSSPEHTGGCSHRRITVRLAKTRP